MPPSRIPATRMLKKVLTDRLFPRQIDHRGPREACLSWKHRQKLPRLPLENCRKCQRVLKRFVELRPEAIGVGAKRMVQFRSRFTDRGRSNAASRRDGFKKNLHADIRT